MLKTMIRMLGSASLVLLFASLACGGGADPSELPAPAARKKEQVKAAPEQTATAVRRAREAVALTPTPTSAAPVAPAMTTPAPRRVTPAASDGEWSLATSAGSCEPLENVRRQVANIGNFKTPQEFARQMQQRGHQTFALDIGKTRDQEVRVKVPDLNLDLLFLRSGLCR